MAADGCVVGGVEFGVAAGWGGRAIGRGRCLSGRGCWARRTLVRIGRGRECPRARCVAVGRAGAVACVVGAVVGVLTGAVWAGGGWGVAVVGGAGVEIALGLLGLLGVLGVGAVGALDREVGVFAGSAFLARAVGWCWGVGLVWVAVAGAAMLGAGAWRLASSGWTAREAGAFARRVAAVGEDVRVGLDAPSQRKTATRTSAGPAAIRTILPSGVSSQPEFS